MHGASWPLLTDSYCSPDSRLVQVAHEQQIVLRVQADCAWLVWAGRQDCGLCIWSLEVVQPQLGFMSCHRHSSQGLLCCCTVSIKSAMPAELHPVYIPAVMSWLLVCASCRVLTMWPCENLWSSSPVIAFHTQAEKSAEAVAAIVAASFRMHAHTAPCSSQLPDANKDHTPDCTPCVCLALLYAVAAAELTLWP